MNSIYSPITKKNRRIIFKVNPFLNLSMCLQWLFLECVTVLAVITKLALKQLHNS